MKYPLLSACETVGFPYSRLTLSSTEDNEELSNSILLAPLGLEAICSLHETLESQCRQVKATHLCSHKAV